MLQLLIVIRLASFRWPKISFWSFRSVYKYFNTLTFYCYKCFSILSFSLVCFHNWGDSSHWSCCFSASIVVDIVWLIVAGLFLIRIVSFPPLLVLSHLCSLSFFVFVLFFCCLIDPGCLSHCCCHPGVPRTTDQPLPTANPLLRVYASAHTNHTIPTIPLVWYQPSHQHTNQPLSGKKQKSSKSSFKQ